MIPERSLRALSGNPLASSHRIARATLIWTWRIGVLMALVLNAYWSWSTAHWTQELTENVAVKIRIAEVLPR